MSTTPRYRADQFTDSGWTSGTAAKKARFVNALIRFIDAGFPHDHFTKALYDGLYNHGYFGFIAHFDRAGFYDAQFSTRDRQRRFVIELLWACRRDYGGTRLDLWSDVKTVLTIHYDPDHTESFPIPTKEHH